jgi:hypothetical protein
MNALTSSWHRLRRAAAGDVDPAIYGLMRLFLGLAAVAKFTGFFSPIPRLILGRLHVGFPLHRFSPNSFAPGALQSTWLEWLPAPSLATYNTVENIALGCAVAMVVGVAGRVATLGVALCGWWLLLVDPAGFKHNLFALTVFSSLLALSPCSRRFAVDALWRKPLARASALPLMLIRTQVVVIYLFSTLAKLNDGWFSGHLLYRGAAKSAARLLENGEVLRAAIVGFRPFSIAGTWFTLAIEAALIVGFLSPRYFRHAIIVGVILHSVIDLSVDVGTYSLVMFSSYIAFIADRPGQWHVVVTTPAQRRMVIALNWLSRVVVVVGDTFSVTGPDGVTRTGQDAALSLAAHLPLLCVPAWCAEMLWHLRERLRVWRRPAA